MHHGTQKVTFGKQDPREYEAQKRAAMAQHGNPNPAVSGIHEVMNAGVGNAISAGRTKYGNSNIMTNELMQGTDSNFAQQDVPSNSPLVDVVNQTGSADLNTSSTAVPQKDPSDMESDALTRRLEMYQRAAGNAGLNLNRPGY